MGCDIHMMAEINKNGKWVKVGKVFKNEYFDPKASKDGWNSDKFTDKPYGGRNYDLFAILADVRNGSGFAGVETGKGFNPISMPRGVPKDASKEYRKDVKSWGVDGHSHSYFTVAELLAFDWNQKTTHYGTVGIDQYVVFKKKGKPARWSGGVWGKMIKDVSNKDMDVLVKADFDKFWSKWVKKNPNPLWNLLPHFYTRVEWVETYRESCEWFVSETIPALKKLGDTKEVRIVFFFDN